jgi:hypothetical protein
MKLMEEMGLTTSSFDGLKSKLNELASRHVEQFRHNPIVLAMKLISEQIEQVFHCFDDRNMYLYLMDEYYLVPLSSSTITIPAKSNLRVDLFAKVLPLMQVSLLYARGVTKGLLGIAALLYPNQISEIPESWSTTESGLSHTIDLNAWTDEINMLREAQNETESSQICISDNLMTLRDYLMETDPQLQIGGVQRVILCDTCLWTGHEGVIALKEMARTHTFFDTFYRYSS